MEGVADDNAGNSSMSATERPISTLIVEASKTVPAKSAATAMSLMRSTS